MSDIVKTSSSYPADHVQLVKYASRIVGNRVDAEDVVQEAYARLQATAGGRQLDNPVGFLFRVVRNLARDAMRHRSVEARYRRSEPAWWTVPAAARTPEQAAMQRQDIARVAASLATLAPRQRLAVEMYRVEGYALREIASRMGVSIATAQRLVQDGLAELARRLDPWDP